MQSNPRPHTHWLVLLPRKGQSCKVPEPKSSSKSGLEAGYNTEQRKSTGKPKLLHGCGGLIQDFAEQVQLYRDGGCSINVYILRCMLVAELLEAGKGDLLSPHLKAIDGEVDRRKFCASSTWVRTFLSQYMNWTWRASTAAAQSTPPNADSLVEDMLQRIAYLCRYFNIPRERVYMADKTFAHLTPDSHFTYAPEGEVAVGG